MKIYIFLFFYIASVFADTKPITLEECIEATLKNHPDIKKVSLEVLKSKSAVDIAKSDYLPQIDLWAQYNPTNTFALPQNGRFNTKQQDNLSLEASLSQKIYDFSKTIYQIDASKKDVDISTLSLEQNSAFLVFNVKNLYDSIVFQNGVIEARVSDIKTKEELYEQAKSLVKEGLKTKVDELSILSSLYSAKDELVSSVAQKQKALSTLSLYMNKELKEQSVFEDRVDNIFSLQGIKEQILAENLELKLISKEVDKNTLLYSASKASSYGSIDVIASVSHQDSLNTYDTKMVGVVAKIPLYSGGRIDAQSQYLRISKEELRESYGSKKLVIEDEINSLLIDIKKLKQTIEAKKVLVDTSKLAKEISEARYKEGLSTYIEALDASTTYLEAKLSLLEAKNSMRAIYNRLEYLKGSMQ
ncbi:MAG: TolC family protein [Sulfurimonas sp.]|nr:TolC family protein [Sulfurimonadaceae bacterium]